MTCPKCKSAQVYVCDSRQCENGTRRRRKCMDCGYRYSTVEISMEELQQYKAKEDFLAEMLRRAQNL